MRTSFQAATGVSGLYAVGFCLLKSVTWSAWTENTPVLVQRPCFENYLRLKDLQKPGFSGISLRHSHSSGGAAGHSVSYTLFFCDLCHSEWCS